MALTGTLTAELLLARRTTISPDDLDMVAVQVALAPTASFVGLHVKRINTGVDQRVNVVA